MSQSLSKFAADLKRLPRVLAQKAATIAAPAITALALQTFDEGDNAYGVPWAPGVDGHKVTLRKTGALESNVRYVAIGTRLRVALGVRYAKYQIGKRPVFPRGDLPPDYVATLTKRTAEVFDAELS